MPDLYTLSDDPAPEHRGLIETVFGSNMPESDWSAITHNQPMPPDSGHLSPAAAQALVRDYEHLFNEPAPAWIRQKLGLLLIILLTSFLGAWWRTNFSPGDHERAATYLESLHPDKPVQSDAVQPAIVMQQTDKEVVPNSLPLNKNTMRNTKTDYTDNNTKFKLPDNNNNNTTTIVLADPTASDLPKQLTGADSSTIFFQVNCTSQVSELPVLLSYNPVSRQSDTGIYNKIIPFYIIRTIGHDASGIAVNETDGRLLRVFANNSFNSDSSRIIITSRLNKLPRRTEVVDTAGSLLLDYKMIEYRLLFKNK